MKHIRSYVYKFGLRPRKRSIFYSPSLNLVYAMEDFGKEMKQMLATTSKIVDKALDLDEL